MVALSFYGLTDGCSWQWRILEGFSTFAFMSHKTLDSKRFAVVLPAGGLGKRMGADKPKQLLPLGGKPLWQHTVDLFLAHPRIGAIVLVVPTDWRSHFEQVLENSSVYGSVILVDGGVERWQSVRNGVEALPADAEYVLVHDVARPFLSAAIVDAVLAQVCQSACIVAKPVHDTVKIVQSGKVASTVDRSTVWLAQTPQAASVALLRELYGRTDHEQLGFVPTDESSLLEHFGIEVAVVAGDSLNDKVTTPEDFERFRLSVYNK